MALRPCGQSHRRKDRHMSSAFSSPVCAGNPSRCRHRRPRGEEPARRGEERSLSRPRTARRLCSRQRANGSSSSGPAIPPPHWRPRREWLVTSTSYSTATPVRQKSWLLASGLMPELPGNQPLASPLWQRSKMPDGRTLGRASTPILKGDPLSSVRSSGHRPPCAGLPAPRERLSSLGPPRKQLSWRWRGQLPAVTHLRHVSWAPPWGPPWRASPWQASRSRTCTDGYPCRSAS